MDDKIEESLRELGVDGFIRFSIKAHNTEENMAVHNAFKEFCKVESDNNYTLGAKKLLEYYQTDYKFEMIVEKLQELEARIEQVEGKPVEDKEKKENAF